MRVVVTGGAGLVGRAITARFEATPLTHADLDITNASAVKKTIIDLKPELVINCAVVGVDECESNSKLARAVNVDGPSHLARVAPKIVHFSSNYVFAGDEEKFYAVEDDARPVNEYGRTKLAGERAVLSASPRSLVVRSSWIFGPGKDAFISTVHRRLRAGEKVVAVADVWASATYVADLVGRVFELVHSGASGIHHVVNAGVCSNETFAREAARLIHADENLIESDSTHRIHRAPRPRYTPLRTLPPLRDWRQALAVYIESDS